jgi:hypothetical protein
MSRRRAGTVRRLAEHDQPHRHTPIPNTGRDTELLDRYRSRMTGQSPTEGEPDAVANPTQN